MARTEQSLEAIKSAMLIAGIAAGIFLPLGIARVIWTDGFTRTALIMVALPFAVVAVLILSFLSEVAVSITLRAWTGPAGITHFR